MIKYIIHLRKDVLDKFHNVAPVFQYMVWDGQEKLAQCEVYYIQGVNVWTGPFYIDILQCQSDILVSF